MHQTIAAGKNATDEQSELRLVVCGRVQAVGFRPFVYRLAHEFALSGWVRNRTGGVEIVVRGHPDALAHFERALVHRAPPLAAPEIESRLDATTSDSAADGAFQVLGSAADQESTICVPPDYFMCADCERELTTPGDRRFEYPFINCTQCGPRYTLIRNLPYDRASTTMADFQWCDACAAEYANPLDRRFHAEPLACPDCGPALEFTTSDGAVVEGEPLSLAVDTLRNGKIVAIKGIGGYHLMCDAGNEQAVARLRDRKYRPHKPLAVMFPASGSDGLDAVRRCAWLPDEAAAAIRAPARPIVLVSRRPGARLAAAIAPGLREIGVYLPYSPLHHLLLRSFGAPLVATSGNLSGEPVQTDNVEAHQRLARIADAFLHHDRPIERPADDPVCRSIAGRIRPIRLGRGNAPLEITLGRKLSTPVLAVGGHLKNTLALAWDDRVVVSPHIGDMDSPRSQRVFAQVAADLQRLYQVNARELVCDAHPGYATTRWAAKQGLPVSTVWHHHAHASALAGEHPVVTNWLIFTWDGVGLGDDGTLWGGEALYGCPGAWQRVASLEPFRLPGGDHAAREPWRSAAALCWQAGIDWTPDRANMTLARQAWQRGVNCHDSSAAGRLFDAAACLVLGIEQASFEAAGPMQLEAIADGEGPLVELPTAADGDVLRADWSPLLPMLMDQRRSQAERAAGFHQSLARSIASIADEIRQSRPVEQVGLTGGVFQNHRLGTAAMTELTARGFSTVMPSILPCNDAGLSFGQVVEWLAND